MGSQSAIEDSTFPQSIDLVNFTTSSLPAQITIPAALVREQMSNSEGMYQYACIGILCWDMCQGNRYVTSLLTFRWSHTHFLHSVSEHWKCFTTKYLGFKVSTIYEKNEMPIIQHIWSLQSCSESASASVVISGQVGTRQGKVAPRSPALQERPIMLTFTFESVRNSSLYHCFLNILVLLLGIYIYHLKSSFSSQVENASAFQCAYWKFSSPYDLLIYCLILSLENRWLVCWETINYLAIRCWYINIELCWFS